MRWVVNHRGDVISFRISSFVDFSSTIIPNFLSTITSRAFFMYSVRHTVQAGVPAAPAHGAFLAPPSDDVYAFDLAVSPDASALAVALSSRTVQVYDAASLRPSSSIALSAGDDFIRSVKWSGASPSTTLFVATGTPDPALSTHAAPPRVAMLHAFDVRSGRAEASWNFDALTRSGETGVLGAAAVSASGTLAAVAVGSSVVFCDVRMGAGGSRGAATRILDVYSESHSDVVTSLSFHPTLPGHLLSAADDGLACIFDTRVSGETDAIVTVLSAGSAIERAGIFGATGAFAYVVTRTGALSLWNVGDAEQLAFFPTLLDSARDAGLPGGADYVLDCLYDVPTDALTCILGSHVGAMHAFSVTPDAVSLLSSTSDAHAATLRCVAAIPRATVDSGHVLFTGAEDGRVVQWADALARDSLGAARVGGGGAERRKIVLASTAATELDAFGRVRVPQASS